MPRIPDDITDCALYVFPSKKAAEDGNTAGGSGFIIEYPTEVQPHYYAVTNNHVVAPWMEAHQGPCLRLTRRIIGSDMSLQYKSGAIETSDSSWKLQKDFDLAVCPLKLSIVEYQFKTVLTSLFMNRITEGTRRIGIGDDVFMVGRFINHQGEHRNHPTARFGHIAQMPGDPVTLTGIKHEAVGYIIECKSISGFSGSPVFAWILPHDGRYRASGGFMENCWLLGVEAGYTCEWNYPYAGPEFEKETSTTWAVPSNTGMSVVIPAERLMGVLESKDLKMQREQADQDALAGSKAQQSSRPA